MSNINSNEGFTNLFSFIIFILILIFFLYFVYKQIKHIFKIDDLNEKEENNKKENNKKEDFLNLYSLNDFLFDVDEDGNFIESNKKEEDKKEITNEIGEKVIHKKNLETKIRENVNEIDNKLKQKENQEIKENNDSILYIVDKNSNKKHIHFTILNEKKLKYLDCQGFYDDNIMINIKDVKNREITKIINKIYNKYTFVYQTKEDDDANHYFIEYRPSQERFIKLYNQNEDKVFYLEKIFYKENNKSSENNIPLYKVYYYANEIGTIYSNMIENNNTKVYQMRLKGENNKNIIAFSFILYLSFLKEEF
jgi:hypothetical protein